MSCCRVCPLKPPSLNRIFIRTHMGPLRKPPFSLPPDPFLQLWNGRIARQGLKLMCLLPWLIIVTLIEKQFPIGCHSFHLSRSVCPISNQKIHWRSLEGLPNRQAKNNLVLGIALTC
ncbi:hypothetical protein F3Y22_tig00110607pilonHSYRG00179 [Hibiscus syriacus]|uniref:Uncharacterized protein n=1 Tax=Hibiscus syriacus TaxID=106335 RepID=A0A6A3A0Y0_HIBSY|nr:hypothetical protein F3Y22_tig00110607pilonHSYRG00179 [Hibiscus syriacus]